MKTGGNYRAFVRFGGGFALIPLRSDSGRLSFGFSALRRFSARGLARAVPVVLIVTGRGCRHGRQLSRLVDFAGADDGRGWWAGLLCVLCGAVSCGAVSCGAVSCGASCCKLWAVLLILRGSGAGRGCRWDRPAGEDRRECGRGRDR